MSDRARVLVAGGGVVGTGLAWALADRGVDGVVVADLDLAGIYASSELNAGGARATWWHPVNIDSCRATLEFFASHRDAFGFRRSGYLWLYEDAALWERARRKRRLQNAAGLAVETLSPEEVGKRFPLMDRRLDSLVGATFSPRDGLVNPNAVRAWYRQQAEALGVRFLNRHYITGVRTAIRAGGGRPLRRIEELHLTEVVRGDAADESGVLREILTAHRIPAGAGLSDHSIPCDAVVNCLGAWSTVFSAKLGVRDHTEPVRRQIALIDVQADAAALEALRASGMIVDASGVYFHPEGHYLLAGYSIEDEPPGFGFEYDGEAFFESELWPRLAACSSVFERCRHVRGWAGLYAVTPDRSGIAGRVSGFSNLFEAHSFTGRGVMQSYGVARGMASLVATGRFEEVDLAPLTRERFDDPTRWVTEELHI